MDVKSGGLMGQGAIPDIDERGITLDPKWESLHTMEALCPGILTPF